MTVLALEARVIVELAPAPTGSPFTATSGSAASVTATVLPLGSCSGSTQQTPAAPATAVSVSVVDVPALGAMPTETVWPASESLDGVRTAQTFSSVPSAQVFTAAALSPADPSPVAR